MQIYKFLLEKCIFFNKSRAYACIYEKKVVSLRAVEQIGGESLTTVDLKKA